MSRMRAAIIGTGRPNTGYPIRKQSFGIAYYHGDSYQKSELVDLVAAADISPENLSAYANQYKLSNVYSDYREMLRVEKPDIVSVCTWPGLHKEMVVEAAKSGVKGILCEKPMAVHYADAVEMHEVCKQHGTILNIAHQRCYDAPYVEMKRVITNGEIGNVKRIEAWVGDGWDLMSWGVHWIDMLRFLNESPIENIFAQADISEKLIRYQHPIENRILIQLKYQDDSLGLLHMGEETTSHGVIVVGDDGMISLEGTNGEQVLVVGRQGRREYNHDLEATSGMQHAIEALIHSVQTRESSLLDSKSVLVDMQIVMAAYESARTHTTIHLPYEIDRNPIVTWREQAQ